ncbi:MAG TPA: hypothetical protein VEW28_09905 [Candidatus Kapabacteria bacterium]|nr:hypothetical protein [Candidatus Kapabacteria bacterium]
MKRNANWLVSLTVAALLVTGALSGCNRTNGSSDPASVTQTSNPTVTQADIQHAIDVQDRHSDDMMDIAGVNGTAVGVQNNTAVIYIYTSEHNVAGIPAMLEDVHTSVQYLGEITARDVNIGLSRNPMYSGFSVGNDNECAAGTISCVVKDHTGTNPKYYILSNNHVFARENAATLGEKIDQPGRYDTGCGPSGNVATLSNFIPINFGRKTTNVVDCAIAYLLVTTSSTTAQLEYTPSTTPVSATVGMTVKKVGRTTGYQTSTISGINATVTVNYGNGKSAKFIHQLLINSSTFSAAGDSGSLICENTSGNSNPVGLLFAGSSNSTIANPIGSVLSALQVDIVASNATP